jgi:WD40 repeat protein
MQQIRTLAEYWNFGVLGFTPDGASIIGGGTSRNIRQWRVSDGLQLRIFSLPGQANSMAISPNGSLMAAGFCAQSQANVCKQGQIRLWTLADGKQLRDLIGVGGQVDSLAWSPDGSLMASVSRDGDLRLWDPANGAELWASSPALGAAGSVAFAAGDLRLAAGGPDGKVFVLQISP